MMIKSIIFDVGGVLVLSRANPVYRRIAELANLDPERLIEFKNKNLFKLQTGELTAVDFSKLVKKEFKTKEDIIGHWRTSYLELMPLNDELLNLVKKLKKNYKVGIITNTVDLHAEINKERGLFSKFDEVLISCEEDLVKPHMEIFELMLKKLNLKAEECLIIDDRADNLDLPKKMGFKAIHFKDNKNLLKSLKDLGIKI